MNTKYNVGEKVYAISFHNDSFFKHTPKVDEWEKDYARIYEVFITSISIDSKSISYWLKGLDGEEWGDCVTEEYVSSNLQDLYKILEKRWRV